MNTSHQLHKDLSMLDKAFELARKGFGLTRPNPAVGCVIANKEGYIIAKGYHSHFGADHAEIMALKSLTSNQSQAHTLYCTLEPCCHYGKKTPPCVPQIIKSNVKRVVIPGFDPNPKVAGKGVEQLRTAGICVDIVKHPPFSEMNPYFLFAQAHQKSFFHLKAALSLDGKMALSSGQSQWITSSQARAYTQKLRAQCDGILIGGQTLRQDNPSLSVRDLDICRSPHFKQPTPIILSQTDITSDQYQNAKLWSLHKKVICFCLTPPDSTVQKITQQQVQMHNCRVTIYSLKAPLDKALAAISEILFHEHHMNGVLVEAGPKLLSTFLQSQHFQGYSFFLAPKILGQGLAIHFDFADDLDKCLQLTKGKWITLGPDILLESYDL